MTERKCIQCSSVIDTDTCDCCGRYNDPVQFNMPTIKVGDRIPAGQMGGMKWVLVVTEVIDEYTYKGILELEK